MKLEEYQKKLKLTDQEMADRLDMSASMIQAMRLRRRFPSTKLAVKIHDLTGGEVTVNELLFPDGIKRKSECATVKPKKGTVDG